MRLLPGLLLLALLVLATVASVPASHEPTSFGVAKSAPAATIALGADRGVAGRGDGLNFTIWLNVSGNGQFQRTWVNLTFNTAADPSLNSLVQGPVGWTQPGGCVVLVASGWYLEWQCLGLRAGSYVWGVPARVTTNATVGRYQQVAATTASQTGSGIATGAANATVWIAGAVVRIVDIDSSPVDSARVGDVVQFWVNATNEATVNPAEDANGTGTAFNVTVTISLDPGLRPGSGQENLTTRLVSLPPSAVLSVNLETIVAENLSAGTVVGLIAHVSYQDFNGHPIGPIQAESPPIYVVQPNVLSTPNLVAGAAIGLGAILTTLVVLLYVGQRKISIDEAFFMTKGGILIRHVSRKPELKKDDDIVASMFVAIQEFVRDSFRREASLDSVAFGRRHAAVVRGELTILAAVISHGDVDYVIPELLAAVRAIETKYWDVLVNWDGNMGRVAGIDEELDRLLSGAFRSPWRVQLA
jgi:hypothetical protein